MLSSLSTNPTFLIFLAGGSLGLLGLSVLCPLLAWGVYAFQRHSLKSHPARTLPPVPRADRIEILIPVHNEAEHIGATLLSIQRAVDHLQGNAGARPAPAVAVRVGADGCTDATVSIVRAYPGVSITEFPRNAGKWSALQSLVEASSADWIILADAGAMWLERWLSELVDRIDARPDALAIAPAYRPRQSGALYRLVWWIEMQIKQLESRCGGPVSLHGVTIAYARDPLKNALAYLNGRVWLNDDVVIPLVLRTLYPDGVVLYPVGDVQDAGARGQEVDWARRRRMLIGNLQWSTALLPDCLRRNPVAGLLALRRLFRMFWAYWLALILLALGWAFPVFILPAVAGIALLAIFSGSFRQLAGAAAASLWAPVRIFTHPQLQLEGSWK